MRGEVIAGLEGVRKRYGDVVALDGIDLGVHAGEVLGVLGPNGAGKTTAVNLLAGLRHADEGAVRLFGGDPRDPATRTRLGVTPQGTGMPDVLEVKELVAWTAAHFAEPTPTSELLGRFGLEELAGRQFGGLSGGQKRRLTVALAFVGDPDLALLDEPTTGLDVSARRELWAAIRQFAAAGKTVVLTSHYLEEVEALADRIVVLGAGRVLAEGSLAEIRGLVGLTRVSALMPDSAADLPHVARVEAGNGRVELLTGDADALVRELVHRGVAFSDLQVAPASLEEAFLTLTGEVR